MPLPPIGIDGPIALQKTLVSNHESGLLPFLAWIGAYDHEKDSNFVVDDLGNDLRRVVAIDFEDAFPWTKDEALEEIVTPPKPPGLSANHDRRIVNKTLSKIEMLT